MLYSSKSTFLTFSSQIPTKLVNLTKFLPFPYMRNIEYLRGTLNSHENYHIPTMRNGKTTEILSSLLWDSHKILWGIFVRDCKGQWYALVCLPLYNISSQRLTQKKKTTLLWINESGKLWGTSVVDVSAWIQNLEQQLLCVKWIRAN